MQDDNKIVQSLWIGGELSKMEQLCVKSYQKNGHEFHLYIYDEVKNIPNGILVKSGDEILPRSCIFKDSRKTLATFSDWFRYKLLYEKGGWWVDMDSVCLRYFDFNGAYCFASEGVNLSAPLIINSFIKAPKEADFLADCLEYIKSYLFHAQDRVEWGTLGPPLLQKVLELYQHRQFVKPAYTFCPVDWTDTSRFISEKYSFNQARSTVAIHLWNEIWRLRNLDKNASYHPNSIFEKLKKCYL